MTTMTKKVTMTVETVGTTFGTVAVIRDQATGRRLAVTEVKPLGFVGAARDAARAIAAARGWRIVDDEGEAVAR